MGTLVSGASSHPPNLSHITDEEVLLASNAGDPAALTELFRRFRRPVGEYLAHWVPGADVEDLVQAVFLEVIRGRAVFEERSSAKAWVLGVARNVWRQHSKKAVRRSRISQQLAVVSPTHQDERISMQLDARRRARMLAATFSSLPEKSQRAFFMCCIEGASARQAGRILRASEAAIWKRLSVTRKTLQQAVNG